MDANLRLGYRLQLLSLPTISIWDLFVVKNQLYGFPYLKYAGTLAETLNLFFTYIYRTILLKIKICFINHLLKFLLYRWKNDVLSFKENDIATFIVEGGWASNDNNSSLVKRPHAKARLFYHLCCGMFDNIPVFFRLINN